MVGGPLTLRLLASLVSALLLICFVMESEIPQYALPAAYNYKNINPLAANSAVFRNY